MSAKEIDPSKVKAGDTVTVRFIETGEEFTTKAYRPESITGDGPWAFLLGWPLNKGNGGHGLAVKYFEILDHQPAPAPEWKPGAVGTATVRGVEGVTVMRTDGDGGADYLWLSAVHVKGYRQHTREMVTDFVPDDARAEVERLRAARTLPTREQVANEARAQFGGVTEAWLDFADRMLSLFEQGGAAPKVTEVTEEQAVEAIKARLSWPSLHWGAESLHPDALPHIANAVRALYTGGAE